MDTFQPIAPRPAPVRTEGLVPWARANLFGNPASTVAVSTTRAGHRTCERNPTPASWRRASAPSDTTSSETTTAIGARATWTLREDARVQLRQLYEDVFGPLPRDDDDPGGDPPGEARARRARAALQ